MRLAMKGWEIRNGYAARTKDDGTTQYDVRGIYEPCPICRAAVNEPNVTTVTVRRAPNPQGRHLRTNEPIYITPHKLPCTYESDAER